MTEFTRYASLAGAGVFITGGATGIGAALVRAFVAQGARVAFIDIDERGAEVLLGKLKAETFSAPEVHEPWFRKTDVTRIDALKQAIVDARRVLGSIGILVNNVANDMRHAAREVSAQSWRQCMAVNLDAAFFAAQEAYEGMRNSGGSIINFSSINALLGPANMAGYVTAKAGLIGMSKALARDFGGDNVRVNAVLPGWVVTEKQLALWLTQEEEAEWMKQVALKRRILPEDVAKLVLFLAADDSAMITGQSFTIDGGRT